jgi:hypothetical protein
LRLVRRMSDWLTELQKQIPPELYRRPESESEASFLDLFRADVCDWYPPELRRGGREELHGQPISMREWTKRHGHISI